MRRTLNFLSVLTFAVFCFSCGSKQERADTGDLPSETVDSDEWKQMDEFHVIMAETFHPYKDSSNLEPLKTHVEHLAMEAEKWADTELPAKVNNEDVKAKLTKLKTDTRALAEKVKSGGSDEEIGAQLTAVHDLFHEIQETWYGGHGDHH